MGNILIVIFEIINENNADAIDDEFDDTFSALLLLLNE